MEINKFISWYVARHATIGSRLAEFSVHDGDSKALEGASGYFMLGKSCKGIAGLDMLISNLTGRAVQLPNRMCIPEREF
eukprot:11197365-Lingulodinium_polyedra.AAC.1